MAAFSNAVEGKQRMPEVGKDEMQMKMEEQEEIGSRRQNRGRKGRGRGLRGNADEKTSEVLDRRGQTRGRGGRERGCRGKGIGQSNGRAGRGGGCRGNADEEAGAEEFGRREQIRRRGGRGGDKSKGRGGRGRGCRGNAGEEAGAEEFGRREQIRGRGGRGRGQSRGRGGRGREQSRGRGRGGGQSRGRGRECRGQSTGRGRGCRDNVNEEAGTKGFGRKSRGRGRGNRVGFGFLADHDRLKQLRADRKDRAKALIDTLPEREVRKLLFGVTTSQPSLLLDVYESSQTLSSQTQRGREDTGNDELPIWCVCWHCIEMPTEVEKLCCGREPDSCLSMMTEMDLYILDPMVLALQQAYRNDLFALGALHEEDVNKANRHAAYRQFVLWQFGRLGRGERRVVPSCCVKKVRDSFPDPNGQYTGYRPGLLM